MSFTLRPYQRAAIDAIYGYFSKKAGNPIVSIPTSGGKSLVMASWREIAIRFACDRTTAWRHWQQALQSVTGHLNSNPRLRVANISSEANGQGG